MPVGRILARIMPGVHGCCCAAGEARGCCMMTYRCWRMRGISCFSGWFAGFVPLLSLEDASPDRAGALRATGAQRPFISPFPGSANTSCARIVNSRGDPPALGCASRGWDARIGSVAPPYCWPRSFLQMGNTGPFIAFSGWAASPASSRHTCGWRFCSMPFTKLQTDGQTAWRFIPLAPIIAHLMAKKVAKLWGNVNFLAFPGCIVLPQAAPGWPDLGRLSAG